MRTIAIAAAVIAFATPALAADPGAGEWLNEMGSGKIRIGPCPSRPATLCGAISWLKDPAAAKATDQRNPDAKLRGRPMLGLPVVWGLESAGRGKWTGGKIYDVRTGRTYDAKLSANPDGTLKVEICLLKMCRTQTWTRG